MRTHASTLVFLFGALVAPMPAVGPATAQDVSLTGGLGRSGFEELGAPMTVGFHGRLPLSSVVEERVAGVGAAGWLQLVFGGRFVRETGEEPGTTCDRYWPDYAGCVEEPIARDIQLLQLELGVGAALAVGRLEVRGFVLGAQTLLMADAEGTETDRSPSRYYPDSTHRGWAVAGEVTWWALPDRLGLVGRARHQPLDFHGCVTDMEAPFCGEETMLMVELGVAFVPRLELPRASRAVSPHPSGAVLPGPSKRRSR
jgi:hypothetical protein